MSELNKNLWPGPKGLIPVTSGKAEDANVYNRNFLDSIHVEMRIIDSIEPNLTTKIFGEEYASPIMMPAFSLLNWVGMEPNEEYEEISVANSKTIRIIKPFADHSIIINQIKFAQAHGAIAVGIDIDHVAGTDGKYDVVDNIPMGPVLLEDLKEYVKIANIPFIAKGVLSVQDALKAKEAGCRAIVLSHHHGRIPFGIAPLQILPRIKEALKDSGMTIFIDCSMDTGYDVYKALALGADAVSVGRGILAPLLKEGKDGVVNKINRMNEELSELMIYTGIKDTKSFDSSVLYIK